MKEFLKQVKPGDTLTRLLAGTIPVNVVVTEVKDGVISCTVPPRELEETRESVETIARVLGAPALKDMEAPVWTFSADTGAEIDEGLGWDGKTVTGSYLVEPK